LNNRCTAKKVAEVSHFHRLDFSPESASISTWICKLLKKLYLVSMVQRSKLVDSLLILLLFF